MRYPDTAFVNSGSWDGALTDQDYQSLLSGTHPLSPSRKPAEFYPLETNEDSTGPRA